MENPIPLRRCTHIYCLNCGLSLQEYGDTECDSCGCRRLGSYMKYKYVNDEISGEEYFNYLSHLNTNARRIPASRVQTL